MLESPRTANSWLTLQEVGANKCLHVIESVKLACKVKKINMFEWSQERTLVVTDKKVYNVKGKSSIKRAILITNIEGVSKTLPSSKSKEFTLHIPQEYDYRFICEYRDQVVDILKRLFAEKYKKNLPVYGIDKPNLRDFTTTEKDVKRGLSKYPPPNVSFESDVVSIASALKISLKKL